jgi:hypothetical protein
MDGCPLTVAISFDEFKSTIFKCYPGSESKRKGTIANMDQPIGEQLWMGILNHIKALVTLDTSCQYFNLQPSQ